MMRSTDTSQGRPYFAAVAAVDQETADKAIKLITVQYEPLPFVLDPEEAMKPDAPKLFPDGNLEGMPRMLNRGNVEQGLKESDKVKLLPCPDVNTGNLEGPDAHHGSCGIQTSDYSRVAPGAGGQRRR